MASPNFRQLIPLLIVAAVFSATAVVAAFPAAALAAAPWGDAFVALLKILAPVIVFLSIASSIASSRSPGHSRIARLFGFFLVSLGATAALCLTISTLNPASVELLATLAVSSAKQPGEPPLWLSVLAKTAGICASWCVGALLMSLPAGFAARHLPLLKTVIDKGAGFAQKATSAVMAASPLGIFGLVCKYGPQVGQSFAGSITGILANILLCTAAVFLVILPAMHAATRRGNPLALLWMVLTQSAFFAFLTRSSVANIPVNLALCERLGINREFAGIAVPLGAMLHMPGAVITLVTLVSCAMHFTPETMTPLVFATTVAVCVLCSMAASGIPGGGVMVLPSALGILGADPASIEQVIALGLLLGLVQDAVGTALNSSSDVYLIRLAGKD